MQILRKFLALLLLTSLELAIQSFISADAASIDNTIENNKRENKRLAVDSIAVSSYMRETKRAPNLTELHAWFPTDNYEVITDRLKFPKTAFVAGGNPPPSARDAFLLLDWDYDSPIIYASWLRRSTAFTEASHYYVFGISRVDMFSFAFAAVLFGTTAVFMWRRPNPMFQQTASPALN